MNHPALKSSHKGFAVSINATFLLRRQSLICFSRTIAAMTSGVVSKVYEPRNIVLAGKSWDKLILMLIDSAFKIIGHAGIEGS
jgi:hypothetical protein